MMPRAMVLCAGYGTRLRPLTDELPKPLVPLGDRPLLAHIAALLGRAGHTSIALNVHHMRDVFRREIGGIGVGFHVVTEEKILGTAGGVAGARHLFGSPPVVVWNGDILASVDLAALTGAAGEGASLAVAPRAKGQGTVGLDGGGAIVRLRGELFGSEEAGGDFVGVSAIGRRALDRLPKEGCLVADVFLPMLRAGDRLASVPAGADWTDLGSVAAYHAANLAWLERNVAKGSSAGTSFVHPTARVAAGVEFIGSIVGPGATVDGEGVVSSAVIWPGASALAPLHSCVVTSAGRVVPAS